MSPRALIFGAGGQDGYYLTKRLRDDGWLVCAQDRKSTDVTNFEAVKTKVYAVRPDHIYMLAGKSTTSHSVLVSQHDAITKGTENVLEAVRRLSPDSKVFIPGSAMQFYNGVGLTISEHRAFEAASPYAIARIHATYLARYYRKQMGLKTYVGYLFNHESPLRKPHHMAQRIALAARNKTKFKCVAPAVRKEHNFAGDIVEAMVTLMEQDDVTEAAIGSGEVVSIALWADLCFDIVGLNWRDYIDQSGEEESVRLEYSCLVSDPTTIKSLGWQPKVSIEELAKMMVRGE